MKHIVIIGNGISGVTAARHIRKRSSHRITIISSETQYFYSRTALMYIYMGHLTFDHTKPYEDSFWKKNKIDLIQDRVHKIDTSSHRLFLDAGTQLEYDVLVIASGSQSNKFGWPGQNLHGVQGLYSYQDLQQLTIQTPNIKHAVLVGGGLIGVEMAEMLRSRNIPVTFLVREEEFWNNVLPLQEARFISRHVRSHEVDLRLQTSLQEIQGDKHGNVCAVMTDKGEKIECQFVGLTVGVSPAIDFLKNSGIACSKGVLVNEFLQTNADDVFAIGDCVERQYDLPGRKRIEQVWYTGRMMGEVVAQTICGESTMYSPGPWFNSAKFFDIEYQTYGQVDVHLQDDHVELYWEDPKGSRAVHFVWENSTHRFIGVNSFGIRLRHQCFDQWLREGRDIHYVMDHLSSANFDPEFTKEFEKDIKLEFKNMQSAGAVV